MSKIVIFISSFCSLLFSQNIDTIAVLDLKPIGVNNAEAEIITSRLRVDLLNTNKFIIIERDRMNDILKEQGFQLSGCTSDACAIEAGKILNVKKIVTGEIGKIGMLYTLSIRLIDVETGRIIKTATEDCKCSIEEVLISSVKKVSEILSGSVVHSKQYNLSKLNNSTDSDEIIKYKLTKEEYASYRLSGLKFDEWKRNYILYQTKRKNPFMNSVKSLFIPGSSQLSMDFKRAYFYFGIEALGITFFFIHGSSNWGKEHDIGGVGFWMLVLNHMISSIDAIISTPIYNDKLKIQYGIVYNDIKNLSAFNVVLNF